MSLIPVLPAIFDQFSEARQKGFLTVMDLKEQNVPLVGTYCTFMPQEIAMAAGAVVVSLMTVRKPFWRASENWSKMAGRSVISDMVFLPRTREMLKESPL